MFKTFQSLILVLVALFLITPTNSFAAFEDEYGYGYTRTWGGTSQDLGYSVTVEDGAVYVTGTFSGTVDFDSTVGIDEYTSLGDNDVFLTKYNADGSYSWTRTWGGVGGSSNGSSVTVEDNEIYVTGQYYGTVDFDATGGTDEHTSDISSFDAFLTKYHPDGSYGWTRTWGGTQSEHGQAVTVENGEIYVTGQYYGTVDFDATGGTDEHTSLGVSDVFLTKYNADGSYVWTRTWDGTSFDSAEDITVHDGEIYVTGGFRGTVNFDGTGGIDEYTAVGSNDAFLTKYNADGSYVWTRTWGGEYDVSFGVSAENDTIYVTGTFSGTVDFDSTGGIDEHISAGSYDVFLTKYNADGSYVWTRTWGGTETENGRDMVVENGEIYITGNFQGTVDFDTSDGTDDRNSAGQFDIFLTKYNSEGSYGGTQTWGGTEYDFSYGVSAQDGVIYVTGIYSDTVNFDTSGGTDESTSAGSDDIFITKYTLLTYGCTDSSALNYNPEANRNDDSCTFPVSSGSSGTSVKKRVANLIEEGETEAAEAIIKRNEKIFSTTAEPINPTPTLIETLQVQLQALLKQFKDLTGKDYTVLTQSTIPLRDLDLDMEGSDVKALQHLLINQGYPVLAGATGYFGTQTQSALSNYQKDHNITPATGYFGPITQKYLKQANTLGLWW